MTQKRRGLTKENYTEANVMKASDRPIDYVTVGIKNKGGYDWEAKGEAGFAAIFIKGAVEIDFMGAAGELELLVASTLLKVAQLVSPALVEKAILRYRERLG